MMNTHLIIANEACHRLLLLLLPLLRGLPTIPLCHALDIHNNYSRVLKAHGNRQDLHYTYHGVLLPAPVLLLPPRRGPPTLLASEASVEGSAMRSCFFAPFRPSLRPTAPPSCGSVLQLSLTLWPNSSAEPAHELRRSEHGRASYNGSCHRCP